MCCSTLHTIGIARGIIDLLFMMLHAQYSTKPRHSGLLGCWWTDRGSSDCLGLTLSTRALTVQEAAIERLLLHESIITVADSLAVEWQR